MISSNKSPELQNALVRRIQRYAQASTIFRTTEPDGDVVGGSTVQRSANPLPKATLLSQPSSLPVGRRIDADGIGSMPIESGSYAAELPSTPAASGDLASAAIEHVEQMQRSPDAHVATGSQATPAQIPQSIPPQVKAPPVIEMPSSPASTIQTKAESETSQGEWGRLKNIIQRHEATIEVPDSQEEMPPQADQPTQTPPSPLPVDSLQRAIDATETMSSPTKSKAPLESIWPVRQVESEATNDEPVVMRQPDTPISTEPTQPPAEAEAIRRKLGDVSSTRQTDSSIELHLPRRPRPAPIQAKPTQEDADKSFWDRMRKAEGKAPETVQRTVETEIGPLPADMWEILGETPPGTPQTSGESAPDIQTKSDETGELSLPDSQETSREETAVPSFLADAATTAPNTPDTLQRAIAAAESPVSSEKPAESATPSTIQRKETELSTPASDIETKVTTDKSAVETPTQAVEDNSSTLTDPQATPTIQRATAESGEYAADLPQPVDDNSEDTSILTHTDISTPIETAPTSSGDKPASVQRAIAAAESPSAPIEKTKPSSPTPPTSSKTTATEKTIQPKRVESTPTPSTEPTTTTVQIEPSSQETVDLPSGDIQRAAASDESSTTPITAVDLNADTAPLPDLPETAVSPPSSTLDTNSPTPNTVQRAIAAAEAPPESSPTAKTAVPPTETIPSRPEATAPPKSPNIQTKKTTDSTPSPTVGSSNVQRKISPEPSTPDVAKTAVSTSSRQAVSTSSRQAVSTSSTQAVSESSREAASTTTSSKGDASTSSTPPISPQFNETDAIQRAIEATEAPPVSADINEPPTIRDTSADKTAVSTPPPPTTTPPESIQRAIQAAEASPAATERQPTPATPSTEPTKAISAPRPKQTQSIQRTESSAQAPPSTKPKQSSQTTPQPSSTEPTEAAVSQPTSPPLAREAAIQRAIVAAEASLIATASSQGTSAPSPIQPSRDTTTIVSPISTNQPNAIIHEQFSKPTPAASPAPMTRETQIQRAIAAAEMAPRMLTSTPIIQRTPQDRVGDDWQVDKQFTPQKTAVISPTLDSPTAMQSPTLMRALAAETTAPEASRETVQWPDIVSNKPTPAPQTSDSIQRTETESIPSDIQRDASQADPEDEQESDEESNNEEVDIEKLAKEVYSQLKRRLAIEWERGRGKR